MAKIEIIEQEIPVYDITVEGNENFYADGFLVHNCGEILLRDRQLCNLSEVIIRPTDTMESLRRKVEIAAIIGTFQSMLTNFKYVSKKWKENCEEERLLGVSMTGIFDNSLTDGSEEGLEDRLKELRELARATNVKWAKILGINPSKAVTCVKPSGCTSLHTKIKVNTGSGWVVKSMAELFLELAPDDYSFEAGDWIIPSKKYLVLDENNKEQEITKLFVNGIAEVYEICLDGNPYKFTAEHKLKTQNGWKRVDQLTVDDEIIHFDPSGV